MIAEAMKAVQNKIVVATGREAANLDGETVLLDINSGHYFGLNEVGSRIIELVASPTTLSEVVRVMLTEYDVDSVRLEADVSAFIQQMKDRKLILDVDGASQ